MFMQALLIFFFFKFFVKSANGESDKIVWQEFAVIGLISFLLTQAKYFAHKCLVSIFQENFQ